MIHPRVRHLLEALVLGGVFMLAFRFPAASGRGWLEALAAFLLPALLLEAAFMGRALPWLGLSILLGLTGLLHWVPATLAAKGPMPMAAALGATLLFLLWETLGQLAVVALARALHRRAPKGRKALAAGLGAAFGIMAWELFAFHVYPWGWGGALGGLPWLARGAAFLGAYGLSGLLWGCGAALAAALASERLRPRALLLPPLALYGGLALLSLAWHLLPREAPRTLDVALVQPNFPAGQAWWGMEEDCWRRSDALLAARGLPRPGVRTLLIWPESAVLGQQQDRPDPRLAQEASSRRVAWLWGTDGGGQNLARGEVDGHPPFLQGKVVLMDFGERMPGPAFLRERLDAFMGFRSLEPGTLGPGSSFQVPTPQGALKVHPLICSEALLPLRARKGLALAGGEILANLTNDGWFERSIATDLHAAQLRLRAVELGLPLVRATLTGRSGLFHADGRWELWGGPLSEDARAFELRWEPVRTPARSVLVPWALFLLTALGTALVLFLPTSHPGDPHERP